ncbi:hypothetical protein scyTo_0001319 [Scyliorhinus torazame]|uniref:Uncharacterized protein n=1 Tax=Scyliorhinus torazame TaxID=75743 RepID=A0A401PBU0_SCYTO|nr:hypothetical protein [Scyliorhinus torazame]
MKRITCNELKKTTAAAFRARHSKALQDPSTGERIRDLKCDKATEFLKLLGLRASAWLTQFYSRSALKEWLTAKITAMPKPGKDLALLAIH